MRTISYEKLRLHLSSEFNAVVDEGRTVAIRWKGTKVVMTSEAEWSGLLETIHLLSSPRNAQRLFDAFALAGASRQCRRNSSSGLGSQSDIRDPSTAVGLRAWARRPVLAQDDNA